MLSPRPHGSPRSDEEANRAAPSGRTRFDEERSFAPAAWEPLSIESFIPLPTADAPANDHYASNEARKRALIVIPTLNEAKVVRSVIAKVLSDTGLVDPLVLVADGGSRDGTPEIVAELAASDSRIRLLHNPARLQSAALNLAVRTLGHDRAWIVRVDAHAEYPENYASTLIEEADKTGATSVVVSMDTVGDGWFQRAVATAQNSVLGTGGSAHRLATEGRWVDHGHHALFRRDAYQQIGGYDETFSHNEDAEFDLRLTKSGGKIWLTDKLRIGYYPRNTARALWKQYFSYGKGRARTVLKHHTALKVRQALPLAVAPAVAGLLASPLFWWMALPALVWACAALGFGLLIGLRKKDAAACFSGPAAMIMHLAWSAGFWAQLVTWKPGTPEPLVRPQLQIAP